MTSIATALSSTPDESGSWPRPAPDYVGRFAPTPSGPLHAGSLVAALGSFLDARAHNGLWLLRLDDLDRPRCPPGTDQQIIRALETHHLRFDETPIRQSQREMRYAEAMKQLAERDRVYRCDCSRSQLRRLARQGKIPTGLAGPIYPGLCRARSIPANQPAGLRFKVPDKVVSFRDRRLGTLRQDVGQELGDVLLQRSDGPYAYHLANVVDDAEFGVSQVVRGADLAELTPVQIALHQAMAQPGPAYLHLPVVLGVDGRKLSKSNHAEPLVAERARDNLIAAAAALGLRAPDRVQGAPQPGIDDLLADWIDQWRLRYPLAADSPDSS